MLTTDARNAPGGCEWRVGQVSKEPAAETKVFKGIRGVTDG
jgi:hypothetical protein